MEEIVRNRRPDDPMAAVHQARRELFAARTARLVLRREPDPARSEHRSSGLLGRVAGTLRGAGKSLEAEGILDLGRPGAAYDHGEFAVTEIGGGIWGGNSGRTLAGLPVDPHCRPGPLWLLGAVEFVNAAADEGEEEMAGTPCRRIRVSADLGPSAEVRSAETSAAMEWIPDLLPDPAAVPMTVWVDDVHLRRVRLAIGSHVHTLELADIGADLPNFDWTRLSTFRTSVREDVRGRPNPP